MAELYLPACVGASSDGSGYTAPMPRNRLIYVGVLVVAAAALLYVGGQLIRVIEWFLPWAAGIGVALILMGLFVEMQKSKKPKPIKSDTATQQETTASESTQGKP